MSLPMKWWISAGAFGVAAAPPVVECSTVCVAPFVRGGDVADRARRTRHTSSGPGRRGSRSRSRGRAGRRPSRGAVHRGSGRPGSWRSAESIAPEDRVQSSRKPCSFSIVDEEVFGRPHLGRRAGERAHGIDQVGRAVGRPALLAGVAVLVGRAALRAGALDESVGEKRRRPRGSKSCCTSRETTRPAVRAGPARISPQSRRLAGLSVRAVVVEGDLKAGEVGEVGLPHRRRSDPARCGPRPGRGS